MKTNEAHPIQARKDYAGHMEEYLESHGFGDVTEVFNGMGKAVMLETVGGKIISKGDNDEVSFEEEHQEL